MAGHKNSTSQALGHPFRELLIRSLSAIVLAVVVLAVLLSNSSSLKALLIYGVTGLMLHEWNGMSGNRAESYKNDVIFLLFLSSIFVLGINEYLGPKLLGLRSALSLGGLSLLVIAFPRFLLTHIKPFCVVLLTFIILFLFVVWFSNRNVHIAILWCIACIFGAALMEFLSARREFRFAKLNLNPIIAWFATLSVGGSIYLSVVGSELGETVISNADLILSISLFIIVLLIMPLIFQARRLLQSPRFLKAYVNVLGKGIILVGSLAVANIVVFKSQQPAPIAALPFLVLIWANDIGAYVAGKFLGGAKLAPRISPGKTWSGLIGGLIVGLVAFSISLNWGTVSWPAALGILLAATIVSLAGHIGDLLESAAKRFYGVKDSGRLIPGHGGILDRVDGLWFASIALGFVTWISVKFLTF